MRIPHEAPAARTRDGAPDRLAALVHRMVIAGGMPPATARFPEPAFGAAHLADLAAADLGREYRRLAGLAVQRWEPRHGHPQGAVLFLHRNGVVPGSRVSVRVHFGGRR